MSHILIVQTSSLSDVCLSLRLVYAIASAHPEHRFTYLVKPSITGVFVSPPSNLEPMTMDVKDTDKGYLGTLSLARKLIYEKVDSIIDLQRSPKTLLLGRLLHCFGRAKYHTIPAKEVKKFRKREQIPYVQKEHFLTLYENLFRHLSLEAGKPYPLLHSQNQIASKQERMTIGFAPQGKESTLLSYEKIYQYAFRLQQLTHSVIELYGVHHLKNEFPKEEERNEKGEVVPIKNISNLSFSNEIAALSSLDLLIAADSAIIRLGELVGTPTLFIQSPEEIFDKTLAQQIKLKTHHK